MARRAVDLLLSQGMLLAIVGVVVVARMVFSMVPGISPSGDGLVVEWLVPYGVWEWTWFVSAVLTFLSIPVSRLRPAAVGVLAFSLTSWSVYWMLVFILHASTLSEIMAYQVLSSVVGNLAIVAMLLWGMGQRRSEVQAVDVLVKRVREGQGQ